METYVSILSKVIITILGIAYPILFQVVSRLDDKYASVIIVKLFNKEKTRSLFVFVLISAVLVLFCWVMDFKAKPIHPSLDFFIQNSAEFLLKIISAGLLVMFFLFVRKILIYYTPTDFVKYLMKQHEEVRNDEKRLLYFKALSDILLQSIRNNRVEIAKTISGFMYDSFRKVRSKDENEYVIYPQDYYDLVLLVSEELANSTKSKFKFLEHRTTGGVWFLGEFSDSKLSDNTFTYIWLSLLYAVDNDNDDMFMTYWANAHQHITFNLTSIRPEYGDGFEILNEEEIKRREADRRKFKTFHYALGGLLLYKEKYRCINRVLNYTTSLPPSYPLLPNGMTDIFRVFYDYLDPRYERRLWISGLFKFPGLEGEFANQQIKLYICRYISLLFIRQYFVVPYYTYNRPMDFPLLPESQAEKKEWGDSILFFKRQVEVLLGNRNLLKSVGFEKLSYEWCDQNGKLYPIEYLDQVKTQLEEAFEHAEINNEISLDKKKSSLIHR